MRILLTGCMGFIGSNYARAVLMQGHQVMGIDNLSNCSINPTDRIKAGNEKTWKNFDFMKADVRDYEILVGLAMKFKPHAIVHLAAMGSVPRSFGDPAQYIDVNERGFANILQLAHALGVKKLVYASSSSVYGAHPSPVRVEGAEALPTSPYGLSKLHNEHLAKVWGRFAGQPSIGLRFFNVYGPGQRPDGAYAAVIPKWITWPEPDVKIYGNGETIRDFTYVGDAVQAICEAINVDSKHPQVVNVGTGKGTSLNELANLIGKGRKHVDPRAGDVAASIASPDFAAGLLGWRARVKLEQGLEITKTFYGE